MIPDNKDVCLNYETRCKQNNIVCPVACGGFKSMGEVFKIVVFNINNECEKQDGVKLDTLVYYGKIKDVTEDVLKSLNVSKEWFDYEIDKQKTNGNFCFIQIIT